MSPEPTRPTVTLTPAEQLRLSYYLCDPFLTFEEAVKLACLDTRVTEEPVDLAA